MKIKSIKIIYNLKLRIRKIKQLIFNFFYFLYLGIELKKIYLFYKYEFKKNEVIFEYDKKFNL